MRGGGYGPIEASSMPRVARIERGRKLGTSRPQARLCLVHSGASDQWRRGAV
jgi:hypothetical protein